MLRLLISMSRVMSIAFLFALMGCDSFPLVIQNQTSEPLTVEYKTLAGKCDIASSELLVLDPGEKFAIQCDPADLLSLNFFGPTRRKCVLTKEEISGVVQEESNFRGTYLLPLRSC